MRDKERDDYLIVLDEIEVTFVPRHVLLHENLAERLENSAARNGLNHGRRAVVVAQDTTKFAVELVAKRSACVHEVAGILFS